MFKLCIIVGFCCIGFPLFCCAQRLPTAEPSLGAIYEFDVPLSSKQGSAVVLQCGANLYRVDDKRQDNENGGLIAWTKDGQLIAVSTQMVNTFQNRSEVVLSVDTPASPRSPYGIIMESTIMFKSVQKADAGIYECRLYESDPRNDPTVNAIATRERTMDVLYYPQTHFPLCQPKTVRYDLRYPKPVTLKCTSEIGNPPVQLIWTNNSSFLFALEQHNQQNDPITSSDLIINSAILDGQNSVFTCTIYSESFPKGNASCFSFVDVVAPFQVSIYPNELKTFIGETAEFECRVQNSPVNGTSKDNLESMAIQWGIEPSTLTSSRIIKLDNILQVKDVQQSDNGTVVSCFALYEDRWFESTSVLYVDQASLVNASAHPTTWIVMFCITAILLSITFAILIWVSRKYRNLIQNTDLLNLDGNSTEISTHQQSTYRELEIKQATARNYTELKTRNQPTDDGNNELEYTYVDEPIINQGTRPVSTEELYDYADTEDIDQVEPQQPEYVNNTFRP